MFIYRCALHFTYLYFIGGLLLAQGPHPWLSLGQWFGNSSLLGWKFHNRSLHGWKEGILILTRMVMPRNRLEQCSLPHIVLTHDYSFVTNECTCRLTCEHSCRLPSPWMIKLADWQPLWIDVGWGIQQWYITTTIITRGVSHYSLAIYII